MKLLILCSPLAIITFNNFAACITKEASFNLAQKVSSDFMAFSSRVSMLESCAVLIRYKVRNSGMKLSVPFQREGMLEN